jgi:hypothetical protein
MTVKVKQIRHSNWATPAPENYWEHLNSIAEFLAESLKSNLNTIHVSDYKEKFGEIRIYCDLADEQLIRERYVGAGEDEHVIRKKCLINDSRWYRDHYKAMISLVPHYEKVITGAADYHELISHWSKSDFDIYFTTTILSNMSWHLKRYEVETPQELYDFFTDVCRYSK